MATQCVGPSLDVDEAGILHVRLAGTPVVEPMPAAGNGARLDDTRGLWVPVEHRALQIHGYRTDSPGGATIHPGSTRRTGVLSVNVTNPSAQRSMLALVTFGVKEVHSIAPRVDSGPSVNAGWSGWGLLVGYDVDADPASDVALTPELVRRDQGVLEGEKSYTHTHAESTHLVLAPSQTSVIRYQAALTSYDYGYVRFTAAYLDIRGIGVTL